MTAASDVVCDIFFWHYTERFLVMPDLIGHPREKKSAVYGEKPGFPPPIRSRTSLRGNDTCGTDARGGQGSIARK